MKIELHSHTSEGSSCALINAQELIEDYVKANIDGIVITNHYSKNTYERFKDNLKENYLKGYYNALKAAQNLPIRVFLGMELNLSNHPNDYLIFGINENFIEKYPMIFDESLEKVIKIVHNENCLIFQAHPFRNPCELKEISTIDGYEFNYSRFHHNYNEKLKQWIKTHQSLYPHLKYICGSDCHGHEGVASGIFETEKEIFNNQDLLDALINYNTFHHQIIKSL